jgi:hypothetical protein
LGPPLERTAYPIHARIEPTRKLRFDLVDIALGLLYNSVDKVAHLRIGRYKGGILKFLRNLLQRLPRCAPAA